MKEENKRKHFKRGTGTVMVKGHGKEKVRELQARTVAKEKK